MINNKYFNNASINNFLIWLLSYLVFPISRIFAFFKISPNFLTFLSLIFTFTAFYFLINDQYFLFSLFWFLNIVFDYCDGQVARLTNKVNKTAFRFDHLSDILKISVILLGSAIYYKNENLWIVIFITNFLFLFFIILNHSTQKIVDQKKKIFIFFLIISNRKKFYSQL